MTDFSVYVLRKKHLERYVILLCLAVTALVAGIVLFYVGDKAPRSIRHKHLDITGMVLFVVLLALAMVYRHKKKFVIRISYAYKKFLVDVNDPALPETLLLNDPLLLLQWDYQELGKRMRTKMLYITFCNREHKPVLTLKGNWGLLREMPGGFDNTDGSPTIAPVFYEVGKTPRLVEIIDVYRKNKQV